MEKLKVLMLNGSPHANGNTAVALREMETIFTKAVWKRKRCFWETGTSGDVWPVAPVQRPASACLMTL